MSSAFSNILQGAVERIPGAMGGAFAASDGEIVNSYAAGDPFEWAVLTAHFGVIAAHVQAALHTFHYGEAEVILLAHDKLDIVLHSVAEGYYVLVAAQHPAPLGLAMDTLASAAVALREEMR